MDGNHKFAPRVDDQLEHDTAGLTHGSPDEGRTSHRQQESPADGEPGLAVHRDDVANEFSPEERDTDRRAELASVLRPSDFPGTAAELAGRARAEHAPAELVDQLEALPDGRIYEAVGELWDDLRGQHRDLRPGSHDPHEEGTV